MNTRMTGYDRLPAMLRGEPVEYLPRLPILMEFAARQIGSDYGAFAADHRVLVEANRMGDLSEAYPR